MDEKLLDAIYEAAIMADPWPSVLDTIARQHGARGGALFAMRNAGVQWAASDSIRRDYEMFLELGWHTRNLRVDRGRSLGHPGFITDTDMFTEPKWPTFPSTGTISSRAASVQASAPSCLACMTTKTC